MKTRISNQIIHYIFKDLKINFDNFYDDECACLFTFRVLPEVCQQILLRTVNLNRVIHRNEIKWGDLLDKENDFRLFKNIFSFLKIIKESTTEKTYEFNENFKKNMLKIINEGLTPMNINFKKKKKNYSKSLQTGIGALEKFLKELFRLEQYPIQQNDNENEMRSMLLNKKLIRREDGVYKLTNTTINLLLSNKQFQIRNFLMKYIGNYYSKIRDETERKNKTIALIKLLFKLCTFEIGGVFYQLPDEYNNPDCYYHLEQLSNFGLINQKTDSKNPSRKKYYVTPLIKCLFEDMDNILDNQETSKFLIVETDFKIYAYTTNELEIKILEFLFEIEYIFPGFIVGHITRNSIRRVLKRDVSAKFILEYLSMHAHPKVDVECELDEGTKYKIPENVAHQILIWEEEKNAIGAFSVLCIYEFAEGGYDYYLQEIKKMGIKILWESKEKSIIIVPKNCEEQIKRIENRKH